ncbi:hypothetical protein ACWEHA_19845 [Amycolatopsis nivea]
MKRTAARILLPLAAAGAFAGFAGGAASAAIPDESTPAQPAATASGSSVAGLPAGLPSLPTGGLPALPTPSLPGLPGAPTGGSPSIWVVPGLDAGSLLGPTAQAPAQLLAPVFNLVTAVS